MQNCYERSHNLSILKYSFNILVFIKIPILNMLKYFLGKGQRRFDSSFLNNSHISLLNAGKNANHLKMKGISPLYFFKTNYSVPRSRVLESSLFPTRFEGLYLFKSYRRSFIYQGASRSKTWKNYNKYYGNNNWNKLKKPALFTAIFCVATTFSMPYVFDYTPLSIFKRNPAAFVYSLLAINGAVFLMWRVPQCTRMLMRYGLMTKDALTSNWSLLGATFSHQSFLHLLVNMFVLQSFGSSLCAMVGVANFATMYLNSSVISSFISLLIPVLTRSSLATASLGASGAVFAVIGSFSYLIPKAPVALFFIPVPGGAWLLFLGSMAYNIAGIAFRWGKYDYGAHLGGCIAGIAYGWWYDKKKQEMLKRRRAYRF